MEQKDKIISQLVAKKKQLLDNLLTFSIQSVLNDSDHDKISEKRSQILSMLERNDRAISAREKQTEKNARQQEKELYAVIGTLLNSISENNKTTLTNLETAVKEFEQEKYKLGKESKISSYVHQTKAFNRFHVSGSSSKNKTNLLSGIM